MATTFKNKGQLACGGTNEMRSTVGYQSELPQVSNSMDLTVSGVPKAPPVFSHTGGLNSPGMMPLNAYPNILTQLNQSRGN